MGPRLQTCARALLLGTLVAAPWAIGGAPLPMQPWLFGGVLVATIVGLAASLLGALTPPLSRTCAVLACLGGVLLLIGGLQLLPLERRPELAHGVMTAALDVLNGDFTVPAAGTLYPAATRVQVARIALTLCAFFGGALLFATRRSRQWLWGVLALNGAALALFGMVQRVTWNGKLFWQIPLLLGGQPFASFVNRNNAAEYLSMCLAGVVGLLAARALGQEAATAEAPARGGHDRGLAATAAAPGRSEVFWLSIAVLLCVGVFASLSRAGIVCMLLALCGVALWLGFSGRGRVLVPAILSVVFVAGVWISSTVIGQQLTSRLQTLDRPFAADGRAQHWPDAQNAARDFPWLGTGLGGYRYANKPYQNHVSSGWYVFADNQYLELLVEGGIGALLAALGLVTAVAWLAVAWYRRGRLAEAVTATMLVLTQGLHSVTDSWSGTTANLITLAVLVGALSSPGWTSSVSWASRQEHLVLQGVILRGRRYAMVLGVLFAVSGGLALIELRSAAATTRFRNDLPELTQPARLTPAETDAQLGRGMALAQDRPDDAELQATLARLWEYRFRSLMAASLARPQKQGEADLMRRWVQSSPDVLFAEVSRLRNIGATDTLDDLRNERRVRENLLPMQAHLRLARRACPLLPRIGFLEASCAWLGDEDEGQWALRREAAFSPSDPATLGRVMSFAAHVPDDELYRECLRRRLWLEPLKTDELLGAAVGRGDARTIIASVLAEDSELLIRFAELTPVASDRALAIRDATAALDRQPATEGTRAYRAARLAVLNGDPERARRLFDEAINANPLECEWRSRYALLLEEIGDHRGAKAQLDFCDRHAVARSGSPR